MKSGFALRKLAFVLGVFCATVLAMAVQKPVFMAWYGAEAAGAGRPVGWVCFSTGFGSMPPWPDM